MNQARKRTTMQKVLSMILVLVMLLSLMSMSAFTMATNETGASSSARNDFMRVFHLDCGRKYFSVAEIKSLIDTASAANYTHIELAVGNDSLRFLLDDMSVTVDGKTYASDDVKTQIHNGNVKYYDAGSVNELSQSDMDAIIAYAQSKNISIIPLRGIVLSCIPLPEPFEVTVVVQLHRAVASGPRRVSFPSIAPAPWSIPIWEIMGLPFVS